MLLEVENLALSFRADGEDIPVLRGVSFGVERGERVALVGESGCGKSMTLLALTRLPPAGEAVISGSIRFDGKALSSPHPRIAYIFQDPVASLDPVMRIGAQLREAAQGASGRRGSHSGRRALDAEIAETLRAVDLREPEAVMRSFPCELSGGMCQRVMIAMALLRKPDLLVADEPTTALDATTQADVMALLDRIVRERGMALLISTHNLGLVARLCNTVNVFYAGQIVESGPARDVTEHPLHPYTQGLLAAVPRISAGGIAELRDIPGEVPSPKEIRSRCRCPDGRWLCAFMPRCPFADSRCADDAPQLEQRDGRTVLCLRR